MVKGGKRIINKRGLRLDVSDAGLDIRMRKERTWAEIDLSAITANIRNIRDRIGPEVIIMAVVKADGYGHGAKEVAEAALKGGATRLGVAVYEEGAILREGGIDAPILVLGHTTKRLFTDALHARLTLTVTDREMAEALSSHAVSTGKTANVHIKIDTGMSRLGFADGFENAASVMEVCALPGISAEGIFTHFVDANSGDLAYTYYQAKRFNNFLEMLGRSGKRPTLAHAANSAAMLRGRDFYYNMVRVGIAMYGLSPDTGFDLPWLRQAVSLKSRISSIRRIGKGENVGYGRKFTAAADTVVATVPIGYADGYPRSLGSKAHVLVRGQRAPVLSTVCMDQLMADVTGVRGELAVGETVTLIGRDGGGEVSVDELAELLGTVNYEIVTRIGKRVPRVYIS